MFTRVGAVENNFFFLLFQSTVTFLAVYEIYEKVLKRRIRRQKFEI